MANEIERIQEQRQAVRDKISRTTERIRIQKEELEKIKKQMRDHGIENEKQLKDAIEDLEHDIKKSEDELKDVMEKVENVLGEN